MAQIFVSYTRSCDVAGRRVGDLRNISRRNPDLSLWLDVDRTPGSQDWARLIQKEIKDSALFIVVLTRGLLTSKFVPQEITWARDAGVPILPIEFDASIEDFRNTVFYEDLSKPDIFHVGTHFAYSEKVRLFELIQRMTGVAQVEYEPPHRRIGPTPAPEPPVPGPALPPADTSVFSFVNFRGGVGKTTLCALAGIWLARARGLRVLLVDLDPQENLSDILGLAGRLAELQRDGRSALGLFEPYRIGRRIPPAYDHVISAISPIPVDEAALQKVAVPIFEGTDGPGSLELFAGDHRMSKFASAAGDLHTVLLDNFETALVLLKGHYDAILIDSGPAATLLSRSAIVTADTIVAPARAQHTSTRGLVHMMDAAQNLFDKDVRDRIRPVFNMARRHIQYEQEYLEMFAKDPGGRLSPELEPLRGRQFESVIPLAESMTDPMRVIGQILQANGDFRPLRAARGAVEAFCEELLPNERLFESDHDAPPESQAAASAEARLVRSDADGLPRDYRNVASGTTVPYALQLQRLLDDRLQRNLNRTHVFLSRLDQEARRRNVPPMPSGTLSSETLAQWLLASMVPGEAMALVAEVGQAGN